MDGLETNIFAITWLSGETTYVEAVSFDIIGVFFVFYTAVDNDLIMGKFAVNGNMIKSVELGERQQK